MKNHTTRDDRSALDEVTAAGGAVIGADSTIGEIMIRISQVDSPTRRCVVDVRWVPCSLRCALVAAACSSGDDARRRPTHQLRPPSDRADPDRCRQTPRRRPTPRRRRHRSTGRHRARPRPSPADTEPGRHRAPGESESWTSPGSPSWRRRPVRRSGSALVNSEGSPGTRLPRRSRERRRNRRLPQRARWFRRPPDRARELHGQRLTRDVPRRVPRKSPARTSSS